MFLNVILLIHTRTRRKTCMKVLAIGAHPDDLEIGCGGTLAKLALQGTGIFMCHITNGNMGHAVIAPDELKKIRVKEAETAGAIIGAEVINLNLPDLCIRSDNEDLVKKIVDIIRFVKPEFIITHSPNDYMKDHIETGKIVFDASFTASVPHFETSSPFYPELTPIYYMDTLAGVNFLPTEYVNITDTIETKVKMLECHQSQIKWMREHDNIDFSDFVRTVSKFRGLQCGADYAEGFTQCTVWPKLRTKRLLP
ncbi:MAG: PIG-L family deacetylase [Ruminiclostridium sp.]|nr:PIG-L family deacetylase [Ruminiclostridium sp.]